MCLIWILILIWFLLFETPQFFNKFIFSTLQICPSYSRIYNISISYEHITTIYSASNVLTLTCRTRPGNTLQNESFFIYQTYYLIIPHDSEQQPYTINPWPTSTKPTTQTSQNAKFAIRVCVTGFTQITTQITTQI